MKNTFRFVFCLTILFSLMACVNQEPETPSSASVSSSVEETPSSVIGTYYHVTFVNYDDTVLQEIDVLAGNEAQYSGETPTKEEDDEFTYVFIGWDVDLSSINSDVTAKATYQYVAKENWGPIIWA